MTRGPTRRAVLQGACAAIAGSVLPQCAGRVPSAASAPAPSLALDSAVGLVPAAGLTWLLDLRTRELLASSALIPALALALPRERLDAFARHHGGVDLRSATELALASYPDTLLAVARAVLDPGRVEAAFVSRAVTVEGRGVDAAGAIVRTWGAVGHEREQLAVLGREGVALEVGRFGPLRAVEAFAQRKLKRALPALEAEPLASVASLLGDAPARAFAPGPFTGAWAEGLGGLLRAATAVGASATPLEHDAGGALAFHVVVTGAWGDDATAAAERLRAAADVLASDPLGRLLGADQPLASPTVAGEPGALHLRMTLDALRLGRGLRDVTEATMDEFMRL